MFLKPYFYSKLKLSRIERGGWLPKRRQRRDARTERVIRHAEIRPIQNIEAFREKLHVDSFRELESPAHTQVERSEVEPASGVSSHTHGTIVVVGIEVTI